MLLYAYKKHVKSTSPLVNNLLHQETNQTVTIKFKYVWYYE